MDLVTLATEILQSLPTIDSERVRDVAFEIRERTSRANSHMVLEMLRELDEYSGKSWPLDR